jgi:hypothetical protein
MRAAASCDTSDSTPSSRPRGLKVAGELHHAVVHRVTLGRAALGTLADRFVDQEQVRHERS